MSWLRQLYVHAEKPISLFAGAELARGLGDSAKAV